MNSYEILKNKFYRIKKAGYHKGVNNDKNSGGITLEHLLRSSGSDFNIPDFYDIEIKAVRESFNNYIDLFNSAPDGSILNGIKWIAENFGYPDKDIKNVKVLKGNVYANRLTKIGSRFLYKLKIDHTKKRVYLCIVDYDLRPINDEIYWDFDSLEEKLLRKDNKLAIFEFYKKEINDDKYYKYVNMTMYKLKSFNNFIECIKNGKVFLVIKTGVFKKGKYKGNFKNHGTSFRIGKNDLKYLFDEIT